MTAQIYKKMGRQLQVADRSVIGSPVDFYVYAAGQWSGWIKGAPRIYERLSSAFHARNRQAFDALVDQLMEDHPCGTR